MNPTPLPTPKASGQLSREAKLRWHTRLLATLLFIAAVAGTLIVIGISLAEEELQLLPLIISIGYAVALLVTAIGILRFASWARILGYVLSIPLLLFVPFGTLLGIYGMVILGKAKALFSGTRPVDHA